jgi:MtaA/CmuA family methyltransferase
VQAISDPFREAADWGAEIIFPADDLPTCPVPLLHESMDLTQLTPPQPADGARMRDRLEAIRSLREKVGGRIPIMGWVEGALAEAADLRGVSSLMNDLYEEPEWVKSLLELCVEVEIAFARAQIEAGADIVGLGDAVASLVSPRMYAEFALPYEQRIFAAVREMGAVGRLHICGQTTHLLTLMAQSGARIIDVDWMVDYAQAAALFANQGIAICGNFDPVAVMLNGSPQQVGVAVRKCLAEGGARSFSAAGCEIPLGTPPPNLLAHARALADADALL